MADETNERLHKELIQLGDMMGDGLHLEPDGKWIEQSYRRVAKALGYIPKAKKRTNVTAINDAMVKVLNAFKCPTKGCESTSAKQVRSGSMRIICTECDTKYQAKRARR